MLLYSINLNHVMCKMKLAETPNCECSLDKGTIERQVLQCQEFESEKEEMMNKIPNMGMNIKKVGCQLAECNHRSPARSNSVRKSIKRRG